MSIAVLLIALAAAGYWFLWRPLPETSGQIQAPIAERATIARDSLGVPHIAAASWEDAIFLQGLATAQDRMWQMDALRRFAAGELAEVVGASALESDRESRRMQMGRIAEAQEKTLPPQARVIYAAYARGVNYYLTTHRGRLPLEFSLLNYEPRPWRIRDTILVGLQMYRTLTPGWRDEIEKQRMLDRGDASKVEYLYASGPASDPPAGSNAWVISGRHTATGKPILANDPHLEFSMPATWYLVHLKAPGLDVTGASLPGIPAVILGHNRRIAWGVTNLGFDVEDLYGEQIDLATGRYPYRGTTEQARLEADLISVRGSRPAPAPVLITRHGPVFLTEQKHSYALRWMAGVTTVMDFPFLDLDRAGSWEEFNGGLKRYSGPGQNFVYADIDGNIGYHAAGALPVREGCMGDVPADGSREGCEWTGLIPFDDLPQAYNPPSGMIVSANQNPFPAGYRYPVNGFFAAPYRAHGIRTRLQAHEKWKPEEMLAIQKDVYSAIGHFLAQQAVKAFDQKHPAESQLRDAAELLRPWNGQMEKGTAAPLLVALLIPQLQKAIAQSAAPGAGDEDISAVSLPAVERLLTQRPPSWFDDYDQTLLNCLKRAIQEGEKVQGSKISRWDYGQWIELRILNPVAGQLPLLGKYFNIGPVPMSGSSTSIKQTTRRLGPSMRMVVDFADLDHSLANITIGESGHLLSGHYRDQWRAYYGGTSFPMQFDKVDARRTLTVIPR